MSGSQGRSTRRFTRPLDSIASVIVPSVADAVDPDELLDRVDVNAVLDRIDVDRLLDRIDVDRLVARVDVEKLIARIDVDAVIDRVDVDQLLRRVDIDAVISRVDLDEVIDRVDVGRVVERVDVNAVADRVDVDRVAERVDVNAVADRVDVDRVIDRVDVNAIADTVDVDRILSRSTKGVSDRLVDLVRRQIVGLDEVAMRTVTRLLGRRPDELPSGPPEIAPPPDATTMSGRYAGPLSRLLALLGDLVLISASFTVVVAGLQFLLRQVLGIDVELASGSSIGGAVALVVVGFAYFWVSTALAGRTVGQAVVGIKVVSATGPPLSAGRAFVRYLVLPLSFALFAIGALMVLVDRRRRALHDVAARSAVVYDWGDRPAALPAPLTRFLQRRNVA